MAARPAMWKGYQILIKALSKVKHDFQCVLIGAGDGNKKFQKTLINKIIQSKLETKIRLINSTRDIQAAMILGDLIIMPSLTPEPFSALSQVVSSPARTEGLSENLTFNSEKPKSL